MQLRDFDMSRSMMSQSHRESSALTKLRSDPDPYRYLLWAKIFIATRQWENTEEHSSEYLSLDKDRPSV
jgi:hypothetical protein